MSTTDRIERALLALDARLASPLGQQLDRLRFEMGPGSAPRMSDIEDNMLRSIRKIGCLRRLDQEQVKLLYLRYATSSARVETVKGADGVKRDHVVRNYRSYEEIAELCGLTPRQVKDRLTKIRKLVKDTP